MNLQLVTALLIFIAASLHIYAAPGDLDPTFGNGGKVYQIISPDGFDSAFDVAIQNDGKIVAVATGAYEEIVVVRYEADGSWALLAEIPFANFSRCDIEIQKDDKILIAGEAGSFGTGGGILTRLNSDGSLDSTFGNAGTVVSDLGFGAIATQSDGKIVVRTHGGLARYNSDGSKDSDFVINPIVNTAFYLIDCNLILQPDGKVLAGAYLPNKSTRALVRYNTNGELDGTFGDSGFATIPDYSADIQSQTFPASVALQSDGKVVIADTVRIGNDVNTWRYQFALYRFNPDGKLDSSFKNGAQTAQVSSNQDFVRSVAVQPDGRIVASGYRNYSSGAEFADFVIVRYRPNGDLDTSFGAGDGVATVDFYDNTDRAYGMALDTHGRAVLAGESNGRIGLARIQLGFASPFDYDTDGKSDFSVWRPGNRNWYVAESASGQMRVREWGLDGDKIVPADFDGDGRTDIAVYRPSEGRWYVIYSSTNNMDAFELGSTNDIPVPADFDGDGFSDPTVWTPATGMWNVRLSKNGSTLTQPWGLNGDKPVPADFNGDGRSELAVWRPSEGRWYMADLVSGAISTVSWGLDGDVPIAGDFSGDGRADYAVYRPSNQKWYRMNSSDFQSRERQWGLPGDIPAAGDYDGDGKLDLAVFRPSEGKWYVLTADQQILTQTFGLSGDLPTEAAYIY